MALLKSFTYELNLHVTEGRRSLSLVAPPRIQLAGVRSRGLRQRSPFVGVLFSTRLSAVVSRMRASTRGDWARSTDTDVTITLIQNTLKEFVFIFKMKMHCIAVEWSGVHQLDT